MRIVAVALALIALGFAVPSFASHAAVGTATGTVRSVDGSFMTIDHGGFEDAFALVGTTAVRDASGSPIHASSLRPGSRVSVTWVDPEPGRHVAAIIILL